LLFWLFGPFSALIWLLVRPRTKVVDRVPDDYSNPDDALAAAARLDQLGEWDAAITLYENAAKRWPDHHDYIANCLQQIKEKQALT
jgi:tetratricopeptide (TPR) repeat protein